MDSLASRFYAGRYSEIATEYVDSATPSKIDPSLAVFVVGSLSFLSRSDEANSILMAYASKMSLSESMEARYYLMTALRRERRIASSGRARKIWYSMYTDMRKAKVDDDRSLFFLYCGLAFYRYVDGRFGKVLTWAKRAYDHAFRAGFPFGRLIAYDLIGHTQLMIGDIRAGLKNLTNSASISESLGRGAIRQAVDVAYRLYRSIYGLDSAKILVEELTGSIRACSFENSYTLASLYIELSRLQILVGEGHKAEQSLREAGEWVYKLDLPFLDANLTFRYAHLALLQGDKPKALELVRSAKTRVMESQDATMMTRILGLEARVLEEMGRTDEAEKAQLALRNVASRSGQIVCRRINSRLGLSRSGVVKHGEDLLGDVFDDIKYGTSDVRSRIVASGFLGLIPGVCGLASFSDAVVIGFLSSSVTICAGGAVRHDADGWPELVLKLMVSLGQKRQQTKEEIAESVWRQPYNPLRHDPLIYALIARTRKTLEPFDHWLKVGEGTYSLQGSVVIFDASEKKTDSDAKGNPAVSASLLDRHPDLSLRQAKIIELCDSRGSLTNKDICDSFEVSEVTAGRDLADLVEKGYLRRVGKGRATAYTKV